MSSSDLDTIIERLDRIEAALSEFVRGRRQKELYTVAEVAERLGRAEFTVRQWCRLGRINAHKRACGRGPTQEWAITHIEVLRLENEGLLPFRGGQKVGSIGNSNV